MSFSISKVAKVVPCGAMATLLVCGLVGCAPTAQEVAIEQSQEAQSMNTVSVDENGNEVSLEAFVNENPDAKQRVLDAEASGSIDGQLSTDIDVQGNQILYTCTYADEAFGMSASQIDDTVISQLANQLEESMGLVKASFMTLKADLAKQAGVSESDVSIKLTYQLSDGRLIKTFLF